VIVVGDGVIGLLTALGLAQRGVGVTFIELASSPVAGGAVYHWSVLPGLSRLGVLAQLVEAGFVSRDWCLKVLATGESILFDVADIAEDPRFPFNLHVEVTEFMSVIRSRLLASGRADLIDASRLDAVSQTAWGVEVRAMTERGPRQVNGRWLVAADGVASPVRRSLGLAFPGLTLRQRCVSVVLEHDFAAQGYASTTLQISDRLGAVVQHLGERRWQYTFTESVSLPEAGIEQRVPRILADVSEGDEPIVVGWFAERMHQRTAERYRHGRIILVGDAAHVANRMIGHYGVSAFFDSYELVPELAAVVLDGVDPAGLDEFAQSRRAIFLDHAAPASADRLHLISQISDPDRLETELSHYRSARFDADARQELRMATLLLQGERSTRASLSDGDSGLRLF
jgi:3-(3-hydroxy-phenyl)propionate hydroxylase/6-hydroxy-3-succinoylpyridine 3-monooxygenase